MARDRVNHRHAQERIVELQAQRTAADIAGAVAAARGAAPLSAPLERLLSRPAFSLAQRSHLAALLQITAAAALNGKRTPA